MAKIHPAKPVSHANGPTSTINSPAKFQNGTKAKMKPAKPVVEAKGATITENSTHIPSMSADKKPKESKVLGEKKWFDPHSDKDRTNTDFPGDPSVKTRFPK